MGGEGSGRKPDVLKIAEEQRRNSFIEFRPETNTIEIPNYSGLQAVRKTDPPITASGHTIQDEGSNLTARTYLNFSGSNVLAFDDATNDATIVSITGGGSGDNFWTSGSTRFYTTDQSKSISGSISGGTIWGTTISGSSIFSNGSAVLTSYTETDPIFLSLSGSLSYVVTEVDPKFISLSGSIPVGGDVTGTTSSIQIDHVNIASIGTNTHAQIDTHIADTSDPHGATLTQTNITSSGMISGSAIWAGSTLSGSNIWGYSTISGSSLMTTEDHTTSGSAKIVGIITHTSATPPTASSYPQGTIYIQYTA